MNESGSREPQEATAAKHCNPRTQRAETRQPSYQGQEDFDNKEDEAGEEENNLVCLRAWV